MVHILLKIDARLLLHELNSTPHTRLRKHHNVIMLL